MFCFRRYSLLCEKMGSKRGINLFIIIIVTIVIIIAVVIVIIIIIIIIINSTNKHTTQLIT